MNSAEENREDTTPITHHLKELLELSPAWRLRRSLSEVFFQYLQDNHPALPDHFDDLVSDINALIQFLDKVDASSRQ